MHDEWDFGTIDEKKFDPPSPKNKINDEWQFSSAALIEKPKKKTKKRKIISSNFDEKKTQQKKIEKNDWDEDEDNHSWDFDDDNENDFGFTKNTSKNKEFCQNRVMGYNNSNKYTENSNKQGTK